MTANAPQQRDEEPSAGQGQQVALPDWLRTRAPEPPRRRLRSWIQDHGVKTLALAIVGAIFVPFGMTIWDVLTAPPGTPSYIRSANAFDGTEAALYREGVAGIVLPETRPTSAFSADEVGAALKRIRQALTAARLDTAMVTGHDPSGFLALLAPTNRSKLISDFTDQSAPYYVTQASSRIPLTRLEPRVDGEITYREISIGGAPRLEITTSYTWVYAFDVPSVVAGRDLVTVTDELVWHVVPQSAPDASARGLHLYDGAAAAENVECEPYRAGRISPAADPPTGACR